MQSVGFLNTTGKRRIRPPQLSDLRCTSAVPNLQFSRNKRSTVLLFDALLLRHPVSGLSAPKALAK
jgi:hypothetical protein